MIDLLMLAQAAEAAKATGGWDVALRALEVLGPALVTLILAGAALMRMRSQRNDAEAARDATLTGVDRATAKLSPGAVEALRAELKRAQGAQQPAVDKRLGELRNGGGS